MDQGNVQAIDDGRSIVELTFTHMHLCFTTFDEVFELPGFKRLNFGLGMTVLVLFKLMVRFIV